MAYLIVKFFIRIYIAVFFKVEVKGMDYVPKKDAAIVCSNHISNFDPVFLAAFLNRMPRYLAKKELFEIPVLSWLVKKLKAIPVDRNSADMKAFKSAMEYLKNGELLGIFAQGTRVKEGEMKGAKAGVALFAVKSNAPVIPVCITGNYKLFSKITINFGLPVKFEEYKNKKLKTKELEEIAEIIMGKIYDLKVLEA